MAYFGPTGLRAEDDVHTSLRTYINCFLSAPFPKMFPRGGGVWDQDPLLMRDFRLIRKFELEWKDSQRRIDEAQSKMGIGGVEGASGATSTGMESALNQFVQTLEEDGGY